MADRVVGTYHMAVCSDCVYWSAYGGSGVDGARVESDNDRTRAWLDMAEAIGAHDLVLGYRDEETGDVCRHEGECYCIESYFSHRDCDLCGQIAGSRWDVVITGFAPSKAGA